MVQSFPPLDSHLPTAIPTVVRHAVVAIPRVGPPKRATSQDSAQEARKSAHAEGLSAARHLQPVALSAKDEPIRPRSTHFVAGGDGMTWIRTRQLMALLRLDGGAGLYFTHLFYSHHLDVTDRTSGWVSEKRGRGLGFHGGAGSTSGFPTGWGWSSGVEGVRANIAGLHGFRESTFSYRSPMRDDGTRRLSEAPWALRVGL